MKDEAEKLKAEVEKYTLIEVLIQDAILAKTKLSVYLVSGIKLYAQPIAQDDVSLLMINDGRVQPFGVNKSAIATVLPQGSDKGVDSR